MIYKLVFLHNRYFLKVLGIDTLKMIFFIICTDVGDTVGVDEVVCEIETDKVSKSFIIYN